MGVGGADGLGAAGVVEPAPCLLGDRRERLGVRRYGDRPLKPAEEAGDRAPGCPERDRVDGDLRRLGARGALERLQQARASASRRRGRAPRAGAAGWPRPPSSRDRRRGRPLGRRRPIGERRLRELRGCCQGVADGGAGRLREGAEGVDRGANESWSVVGGVATCASPANTIRPTRIRFGALSRNVRTAAWAAASRVGRTSLANIEPDWSRTRITVARSVSIKVFACGRATPMQSEVSAVRKRASGMTRRHERPPATDASTSMFVNRTAYRARRRCTKAWAASTPGTASRLSRRKGGRRSLPTRADRADLDHRANAAHGSACVNRHGRARAAERPGAWTAPTRPRTGGSCV